METFAQAFKIFSKSWKMMLIIFLPFYALFSVNHFAVCFFTFASLTRLEASLRLQETIGADLKEMAGADFQALREIPVVQLLLATIGVFIIDFLFTIATVYASAKAYSNKNVTARDVFRKVISSWKGPFITGLYSDLIAIGVGGGVLYTALIMLFLSVSRASLVLLFLSGVAVALVVALAIYLILIGRVGMVISVVKEDCYGLQALASASVIAFKRKRQGFIIVLVPPTVAAVILALILILLGIISTMGNFAATAIFVGGAFISLFGMVLLRMFMFATFTVFYLEDKAHAFNGYEMLSVDPER